MVDYYMCYTAYSPKNISVAMASTKNFISWERYGIILPESPNKDAALFPEKINGQYVLIHRLEQIFGLHILMIYFIGVTM